MLQAENRRMGLAMLPPIGFPCSVAQIIKMLLIDSSNPGTSNSLALVALSVLLFMFKLEKVY